MLEITRELLSHYMRVQGWKEDGRGEMSADKHRWSTLWWGREASVADGLMLEVNRSGETMAIVAFRLGLCAAAERDFEEADHLTMPLGSMGMFTADDEHGASVLLAAAKRRLADAGIDPAAWESAREP